MLPFITQPAVAPACYVPAERDASSQVFKGAQYLSRTVAADGNRRKGTIHFSFQATCLTEAQAIACGYSGSVGLMGFSLLYDNGGFSVIAEDGVNFWFATTAEKARDCGGFYRGTLEIDTAQAVEADRFRLYIHSTRQTLVTTIGTVPAQNAQTNFCRVGQHAIGRRTYQASHYLSGLLAEIIILDGVLPGPEVFEEINIHGVNVRRPTADIYAAIAAAGGFGVNGCHLDFSDPLNPGNDVSGQGNHWTPTGFDAAGKDTVASTPTNVFATLNPIGIVNGRSALPIFSEGGLKATANAANTEARGTLIIPHGDWIWEVNSAARIGIATNGYDSPTITPGTGLKGVLYEPVGGGKVVDGVASAYGASFAATNVIGIRVNTVTSVVTFYRDGVPQGDIPFTASGKVLPAVFCANDTGQAAVFNFGQRAFVYPGAYGNAKPLCTNNLPEPAIKDPAEGFVQAVASGADIAAVLNAATAHWTGSWVEIIKRRDASEDWRVRFSDDPANAWATNSTNAKGPAAVLTAAGSYVGYRLRLGKKYGVYTAEVAHTTGIATTVTHNLGTARNAVIATRVSAGGGDRYFYHPDLAAGSLVKLNSTGDAAASGSINSVGKDTFLLDATLPSGTYRVVVFATREGYLNLAKVVGNNSPDGSFVPMDIAPEFLLIRATNGTSNNAVVLDRARSPGNEVSARLHLNIPDAQTSSPLLDMVVGGVKFRAASTTTAVLLAIGRPVGGVCVAPATAR